MFSEDFPRWKGVKAHVPHRQEYWGTARDSEHCQSTTKDKNKTTETISLKQNIDNIGWWITKYTIFDWKLFGFNDMNMLQFEVDEEYKYI